MFVGGGMVVLVVSMMIKMLTTFLGERSESDDVSCSCWLKYFYLDLFNVCNIHRLQTEQ